MQEQHEDYMKRRSNELREQFGQTFVIVTHNEGLAEMSDRQVEMQDGRLAFGGVG